MGGCYRVIQNIADMKPKARYIVATDDSQTTLEEIVKVGFVAPRMSEKWSYLI